MDENINKKRNLKENVETSTNPLGVNQENDHSNTTVNMSKPTSLGALVTWNISKVLERNPTMDIKNAIISTQCRIEQSSGSEEVEAILSEHPCQRHLVCALLAWQELGHNDADSLCRFVDQRLCELHETKPKSILESSAPQNSKEPYKIAKTMKTPILSSYSMGPVLKLPVETKLVMRLDNVSQSVKQSPARPPCDNNGNGVTSKSQKDIMSKIDQACCLDSVCAQRLEEFDSVIHELRTRASQLAGREAERVELLDRAETAWRDLEIGYQRRLTLAEEKEEDITKQSQKVMEERNTYKNECTKMAKELHEKTKVAEKDRASLKQVEKDVCALACTRLKLNEESSKGDAVVAEHQCRAAQADRDLQFKEEQARRKLSNLESELDSARALTLEAERALRAEMSSLRGQIEKVSKQLLDEDTDNEHIKAALEDLRQEKSALMEDLESCKVLCDDRMQGKIDELKKKREQMRDLKDKVMECRCKLPVDAAVEVKRTPSLAALCKCTPEDKILDSCSCTSLRGTLLANLLADLFAGLQTEMGSSLTQMPCQLLKCLEDKHNWDRSSVVKNNLKNYFSQLLVGELDIAIATSIEKYHAKWVGQSCADAAKMSPEPGEDTNEGWQQRAIEKRAQKLASQLAEELFQNKADELTQRAKEIVSAGPPPCECKPPKAGTQSVLYPCLLKNKPGVPRAPSPSKFWHQTVQDVNQIRMQIEELKKASIKKEDLKMMENKITKILQRAAGGTNAIPDDLICRNADNDNNNKHKKVKKDVNPSAVKLSDVNRSFNRKRFIESTVFTKKPAKPNVIPNNGVNKLLRAPRKNTYSVNMCLCSMPKEQHKAEINKLDNNAWKQKVSKDGVPQFSSSIRQTKPINARDPSHDTTLSNDTRKGSEHTCPNNCVCFHKIPSNTSIDQLLETLKKWKSDIDSTCDDKHAPHKATCVMNKLKLECILDYNQISLDKQSFSPDSGSVTNSLEESLKKKELKTKSSTKSIESLKERSRVKEENCLVQHSDIEDKINVGLGQSMSYQSKSGNAYKESGEIRMQSTDLVTNTESEYMGDVNLEKSIGDCCNCEKNIAKSQKNPAGTGSFVFKCIHSSKCNCEKSSAIRQHQIKPSRIKKEKHMESNAIQIKKEKQDRDILMDDITKTRNQTQPIDNNLQCKSFTDNKFISMKPKTYDNDYQIKFLGVTLSNANPENINDNHLQNDINNKNYLNSNKITEYGDIQMHNKKMFKNIECLNDIPKPCNIKECAKNVHEHNNSFLKNNIQHEVLKNGKDLECSKPLKNQYQKNNKCESYETNTEDNKNNRAEINDNNNIVGRLDHFTDDTEKYRTRETKPLSNTKLIGNDQLTVLKGSKTTTDNNVSKEIPSCQCNARFDEFKNFFNATFPKQLANDIAVDVQSFTDTKQLESCVCCDKLKVDEANNLEENAFHLLEEHLKKKMDEYKQSSCNSMCVPPEEEQKLFTTILERIKKLIADSTNQIACKCSAEKEITKGSWNRAYGLLQEYLKMKIQKVQCSCLLAEDNGDLVLPAVLEKICELIEYDFQRLKDVSKNNAYTEDNKKKSLKPGTDEPERDLNKMAKPFKTNNMTYTCAEIGYDKFLNTETPDKTGLIKDTTSQVPPELEVQSKSCSPMKIHTKSLQTLKKPVSVHSVNTNKIYRYIPHITINTANINSSPTCKSPRRAATDLNLPKTKACLGNKRSVDDKLTYNNYKTSVKASTDLDIVLTPNKGTRMSDDRTNRKQDAGSRGKLIENRKMMPVSQSSGFSNCNITSHAKTPDFFPVHRKKSILSDLASDKRPSNKSATKETYNPSNEPYIGYTVDCSCNTLFGTCACSKSMAKADINKINNIFKESMPDERYYKNVSYIMESHPIENTCINYNPYFPDDDMYLKGILKKQPVKKQSHECETDISLLDKDFVLKRSMQELDKYNTMTNTIIDDMNIGADCFNEAAVDYYGCCSNTKSMKTLDSLCLKNSIYFPSPILDNVEKCEDVQIAHSNLGDALINVVSKHCECDMVPICHVKMLIENIETKLATCKCTCDSLIPQVCPEHSTK